MKNPKLLNYLQSFITEHRKLKFEEVLANRTRHFTVVLEDIYQKHNTSAVVRSCDVFGIQDLHIIENKYKSYLSNQVAKGAEKWLSFQYYRKAENNNLASMESLRKNQYQIIATTPHNDSCFLKDFDISKKSAFVFGVEKEGVSQEILETADGYLKIPMVGFTESLNISVAVAIILQNITERLRNSEIPWQLSKKEKNELRLAWTKRSIKNVEGIIERYEVGNSKFEI